MQNSNTKNIGSASPASGNDFLAGMLPPDKISGPDLIQYSVSGFRQNPKGSRGLDPRRLRRVVAHINENLGRDITVEGLASVASLSRSHFSRSFKAATGRSPSRYIEERRHEFAKSLLLLGRTITQVAYDCGFSSESNFTRSFRRRVGMTPGQYRSNTQENLS